jgi:hypothetical protein
MGARASRITSYFFFVCLHSSSFYEPAESGRLRRFGPCDGATIAAAMLSPFAPVIPMLGKGTNECDAGRKLQ